ncbi:Tad domain-containing protein [Brevibacillus sp. SYSU BS000544]|uniref:Tad domain-containing protein n=1 Tax=Brevibacillus sp. SYSU BS000544 TaxID=3416443 RepID=UPI003CE49E20
MISFFKGLLKQEEGNAVLLISLSMVALLTMVGLVIDGGNLMLNRAKLQKTANAAVLSGAQELTNTELKVNEVIQTILREHEEEDSLQDIVVSMEDKVSIDLEKQVPLTFSRLFGRETAPVSAHAAAELGVMGRAKGAAPLGIDESIELEYFKEYKLKVDQTDVDQGYFGVLALGGTGSETYEENLRHGYQNEIKVGDVLDTQTGNIAGKTRTVVRERVNGCSENPRDVNDRDCSRVILIPVYEALGDPDKQLKSVRVKGFAYFYITDPMSATDTAITGMFIKRAGTGFTKPDSVAHGAFSIRLTE